MEDMIADCEVVLEAEGSQDRTVPNRKREAELSVNCKYKKTEFTFHKIS
jgi:hypothetical protein